MGKNIWRSIFAEVIRSRPALSEGPISDNLRNEKFSKLVRFQDFPINPGKPMKSVKFKSRCLVRILLRKCLISWGWNLYQSVGIRSDTSYEFCTPEDIGSDVFHNFSHVQKSTTNYPNVVDRFPEQEFKCSSDCNAMVYLKGHLK